MMRHYVPLALGLCEILLCLQAHSQPVTVGGTVSTSGVPVRYALVTFENTNSPADTSSVVTDSSGHYRISLVLTSVAPGAGVPATFALAQNYPNPFSSSTVVPYALRAQADIQVTIYDILGRVVKRIAVPAQSVGTHSVRWDGRNTFGQRVASGVYFYTLQAGSDVQTRKMILTASDRGDDVLPAGQASLMPDVVNVTHRELSGGTYSVLIRNTNATSPFIVSSQFDNVTVTSDTALNFSVLSLPLAAVYVDSVQQVIRGFGAANILPWRPDMTAAQVQTAFGNGPGQLGFTILRLRVPYTDNVSDFSAQVPTAKLAQSLGAIVFASPWTPPPAMKSNNNIVGGTLLEGSYAAYASHLKNFADYMASNGAPLYAVSLQNEPDANVTYESCSWNATQFLNFMKDNAQAIGTKVIMPESMNFTHSLSDSTLNDSTAAAHVAIIGGHLYGGGLAPYPLAVNKGKDVWMTEHLVLDTTWTAVLATGKEIHDCMVAGMNAYVWWYLVRFYGPMGEDGSITKRGYVMSQFARFVRPGYYRIQCNPRPQTNVYLSAYKDSLTAKIVIVALNLSPSALQQGFSLTTGSTASFAVYSTSQTRNCEEGMDIVATNGSFVATLEPSSITTFISR